MSRNHLFLIFTLLSLLLVGSAIAACTSLSPAASSPAPTAPTGTFTQAAPLTAVDWRNFTYMSSCYSDKPQQFVVRNGEGVVDGIHLQVYKPVYGDLTGHGQSAAAVPYSCSAADFAGVSVFGYTGNANKPVLMADISVISPGSNNGGSVDTVTINHGII